MSSSNPAGPLDSDAWRRINDLFHRALEQPPDRRDAFLADSCAGDEALRREVASLLASHARAADFIEEPAQTVTSLDAGQYGADAGCSAKAAWASSTWPKMSDWAGRSR